MPPDSGQLSKQLLHRKFPLGKSKPSGAREEEQEKHGSIGSASADCPSNLMKLPRRTCRPLFLLSALAAVLASSSASAAFIMTDSGTVFTPSFRGESNTTYFGWSAGTWDGNADSTPPEPTIPDIVNGTPSINPGALAGTSFLTQSGTNDVVSSTNNIYSSVAGINAAGLQLHIPTAGVVGSSGYTTIIIQGLGLNGAGFGGTSGLDAFGFGAINGILPEYVLGTNADVEGQWWAKWEIPGNAASYTVDIVGVSNSAALGVLSVTELHVDTLFSNSGYAPDFAVVPEPSALLLSAFAGLGLIARRRR